MVTQIRQVEGFVKQALDASVEKQSQDIEVKLQTLKAELTADFAAMRAKKDEQCQEKEDALKAWVLSSGEGVEKAVRDTSIQMRSDKLELETRMEAAIEQMTAAVIKLASVEQGILPALEPRLHQMESGIASLEAQRKALMAKARAADAVPEPAVAASPKIFEMSPDKSGPANVPWPSPEEASKEAARAADPELKKNVWERKGFDKRLSKYSNEKGDSEFKDWAYELRRITASDPHFHEFLKWIEEDPLEETHSEMTKECLDKIGKDKGWNTKWLNEQLYGILAEATGLGSRAKGTVMAVEVEKDVNGAKVYRAFAIEHLDGSQQATVALGRKITKPPVAPMDEFEDRLRLYDQDRERCERLTKQLVGEPAFVHVQDMIPQEARARFELEKHNFSTVAHLRDFFKKVIADCKASGEAESAERTRGGRALQPGRGTGGARGRGLAFLAALPRVGRGRGEDPWA